MKKSFIYLFTFSAAAAFLSSCSSYTHSYRLSEVPDRDISVAERYVVDIQPDFSKIVKAVSGKNKTEKAAREEAYYKAITENNIHIVVDPIYSIETTSKVLRLFGGKSRATISGFAGYYANPRTASKAKVDSTKAELEAKKIESDILDLQIKDLDKFSKIAVLGQEQTETHAIDTKGSVVCCGSDGKSSVVPGGQFGQVVLLNKSINKPSLVDQYQKFLNVVDGKSSSSSSSSEVSVGFKSNDEGEPKKSLIQKIKATLAKIPLIGGFFKSK